MGIICEGWVGNRGIIECVSDEIIVTHACFGDLFFTS